jgi:hypothetical protein
MIGLLLGKICSSFIDLPPYNFKKIPRVEEPYNGDQKGSKKEHHRFLFDYSIAFLIYVMASNILN